jgi:hypothetical protein
VKICFSIALTALVLLLAAPVYAQRPGETRYERLTNAIFDQPAYNGNPSMLDGYGTKTAAELGLTDQEVYNEYPQGPVVVKLHATSVLYYDTASMEIKYLDGCRRGGRDWKNRVKRVTTRITTTNTVRIECWDLNGNGRGDNGEDRNGDGRYDQLDCVTPGETTTVRIECWDLNGNGRGDNGEDRNGDGRYDQLDCVTEKKCPTCPVGKPKFKFSVTFQGRLKAAGKQLFSLEGLAGIALGGGASALGGGNGGDIRTSLIVSAGENALLKGMVADANRVKITIPYNGGTETVHLEKGKSKPITVGGAEGEVSWNDEDGVTVEFSKFVGCYWNKAPRESLVVASYSQVGNDTEVELDEEPKYYVPTPYDGHAPPPPNKVGMSLYDND